MTFGRLLGRNLLYHGRGNLAVLLGVTLGTAVLTGALLVGDSLRGSLRTLTLERLGWIEQALLPGHFFRAQLAQELPATQASPVVLLTGSAANTRSGAAARRVGGVTVLGVDARFWRSDAVPLGSAFWQSQAAEVALNETLAEQLGVGAGDALTLAVPKPVEIPRESLLGKRKARDVLLTIDVKVRLVLPDGGLASFALKPTPEPARNIFVPLGFLQSELGLAGQANGVLLAGATAELTAVLRNKLTLADWGLTLQTSRERARAFVHYLAPNEDEGRLKPARWRDRVPPELAQAAKANGGILTREQVVAFYEQHHPYVSLESRQLLLRPAVVDAATALPAARRELFVSLADHINNGATDQHYVVVGAVHAVGTAAQLPDVAALGPEEIVLLDTPQAPWHVKPGATVNVAYYQPDDHNRLTKSEQAFTVRAVEPLRGPLDDPDLTPTFPGLTDKLSMGTWENPPFPYNPRLVTKADEDYWTRYRATPRAYVNLDTAHRLWGSRFGSLTSVQFFGVAAEAVRSELLAKLPPERGGFVFQAVRANAEHASNGSTDFGMLFIGFSCFLISSALLLVGLLFRLNLERRASEIGLLLAVGWSPGLVRWLLLAEGAVLAVVGAGAGLLVALGYARLMLELLRANWPGGDNLAFLQLHVEPLSLVIGGAAALAISLLTIAWAARVLGKLTPRALLAGVVAPPDFGQERSGRPWSAIIAVAASVGAAASLTAGFFVQGDEAKAGSFFGSGALLLVAGLAVVRLWLRYTARATSPRPTLTALGVRNAGRHAVRSLLTVGLLAAATFLIVAVESFHKDVGSDFRARHGGSGGYALIIETAVPIFEDLNQPAVRTELGLTQPALQGVTLQPCRVRSGDDASCLNLYQALQPRMLGVQPTSVDGRFRFGATLAETAAEKAQPWSLLQRPAVDGALPAIVDATTAEYGLHVGLGDTLTVTNERGEPVPLRIVGLLDESIFQSEIVVSDATFRTLFPTEEGFSFFLVDVNADAGDAVGQVQAALETDLAGQGVRVQTAASRLLSYLAVENMYLTTFQALGGLGLILGAAGLAIILLRGVWERRGELALLRALGFGPTRLAWLVLSENLALLLLGLAAGTLAALLSVAPHLAGSQGQVLWLRIGLLLLLVLAAGLGAGSLAVVTTLRAPLLSALRRE